MAGLASGVYQPRHPQESLFYQILSLHYPEFLSLYPSRFLSQYGPLRPVIEEVLQKYLACGDLAKGFARIRCENCHHEYLLAFSCKCRYFCPSCSPRGEATGGSARRAKPRGERH